MWIASLPGIYSLFLDAELHLGSIHNPVYN